MLPGPTATCTSGGSCLILLKVAEVTFSPSNPTELLTGLDNADNLKDLDRDLDKLVLAT